MTPHEFFIHISGMVCLAIFMGVSLWRSSSRWTEPDPPVIPPYALTLKTWPEFFHKVWDGEKPFELRKADREFQPGQIWYLREWIPPSSPKYIPAGRNHDIPGRYTGSWVKVVITYVMYYQSDVPASGIYPGYCVWGFRVLEKYDEKLNLHLNGQGLII